MGGLARRDPAKPEGFDGQHSTQADDRSVSGKLRPDHQRILSNITTELEGENVSRQSPEGLEAVVFLVAAQANLACIVLIDTRTRSLDLGIELDGFSHDTFLVALTDRCRNSKPTPTSACTAR